MFLTTAVAAFEAPIASALFPVIGLRIILLFTSAVVIAAIACVLRAKVPLVRLPETVVADSVTNRRGYKPLRAYSCGRRGLVALLGFFALFNFVLGFAEVSDRSIIQGFASAATLDIVLGSGLVGMLAVSVGITIWGLPRQPVRWLLIYFLVLAAALVIGATR